MPGDIAYGWYGKVPHLGDFTRARLSPGFIQDWDVWGQAMLTKGRSALGGRWKECYMTAPLWRFALAAGVCGPNAAAGIWMPSVDRVGRQFPLCLCAEASADEWPGSWQAYCALAPLYPAMESAALSMLEDGATTELLSDKLAQLPHPEPSADHPCIRIGEATGLVTRRPLADALAARAMDGYAAIWVAVVHGQNRILTTEGLLESPEEAVAFFDLDAACWSSSAECQAVPA